MVVWNSILLEISIILLISVKQHVRFIILAFFVIIEQSNINFPFLM